MVSAPAMPKAPPPPGDPTDETIRNARLAERRRQLGLQGRMSTFLTDFQGQSANGSTTQSSAPTTGRTLLGG